MLASCTLGEFMLTSLLVSTSHAQPFHFAHDKWVNVGEDLCSLVRYSGRACKGLHLAQQCRNLFVQGNGFCRIAPMFECVFISFRCSRRHPAVHPTPTVWHCW